MSVRSRFLFRFFLYIRVPWLLNLWRRMNSLPSDIFNIIEIETFTACNKRCGYCPNAKYDRGLIKNGKRMKPELFYQIIDQLSEIGFSGNLHPHFYGEPLLDERLYDFLSYARRKLPKALLMVFTNGDLLTLNLYQKMTDLGIGFVISTHSDGIREKVGSLLKEFKQKTNCVPDNIVWNEVDKKALLNNRSSEIQLSHVKLRKKCDWPKQFCIVNYKGELLLCCNDYHHDHVLAKLTESGLIKSWSSKANRDLRKEIGKGHFTLDICKKCGWGTQEV